MMCTSLCRASEITGPVKARALEESQRVDVVADQHVLGLLVVIEHHLVRFATYTGLLVTTKGGMCRVLVVAVGPDTTGLNATTHAVGAVHVAAPYTGTQTELGVVGDGEGFGLVLEGGNGYDRSKDLFLEHAHVVGALEQSRLDVVAVTQIIAQLLLVTTDQHFSPFGTADVEVAHDLVELLLRGLSTDHGFGIERVATLDLFDAVNHASDEFIVDVFLHQQT